MDTKKLFTCNSFFSCCSFLRKVSFSFFLRNFCSSVRLLRSSCSNAFNLCSVSLASEVPSTNQNNIVIHREESHTYRSENTTYTRCFSNWRMKISLVHITQPSLLIFLTFFKSRRFSQLLLSCELYKYLQTFPTPTLSERIRSKVKLALCSKLYVH